MLKIKDLNRNEELSTASMRKVAGGAMECLQASSVAERLDNEAAFFHAAGFSQAEQYLTGLADGLVGGACGDPLGDD